MILQTEHPVRDEGPPPGNTAERVAVLGEAYRLLAQIARRVMSQGAPPAENDATAGDEPAVGEAA